MVAKRIQKRMIKLLGDRRGTAEIVGSVMFLVILLFVFTNVYLWHDSVSREMNGVLAEKMNSPVSVSNVTGGLVVINNGGFEVALSRLWLVNVTSGSTTDHTYVDLEPLNVRFAAGAEIRLLFVGGTAVLNPDGSILAGLSEGGNVQVFYPIPDHAVRCKILTTLGNMATCTLNP